MISFTGKTVLITGASGGIGREVARQMALAGANVALCDLSTQALDTLAHELAAAPGGTSTHTVDVADAQACRQLAQTVARHHGGIDYLVHSAGIYPEQRVEDMSDEQWRKLMSINLDGTFYMCRSVIPHLTDHSAIVTLSSLAGHRGSLGHAHYSASKGAVSSLSKSLALELAPRTRVNIVAPGIIATSMAEPLMRQKGQALLDNTPMKRFGTAAEVASVIAFLCSDLASFVTGETLHVNGGLYIV
ncbi:SDR family NAD(P)-dependent oxidoreductase [Castellaniella caeni]|uniref:SDR family NAD(P)-dependent oxidoreductase n=1 Tax=Castellaniella caeni TaxID=266123 RepID=UPI00082BFEC4|nr:SDR family NAD(P)-dependent oxidoreductase [Castellaniella caeni]